nr:phospholipase-like protein [Tanacetum cinerariifolium]
ALVAKEVPNIGHCNAIFADDEALLLKENEGSSRVLPCQLPPKELNLGSFTLPCTIGSLNVYDLAYLGASVNIMPYSMFKSLELASLKETTILVEMADM